MKKVECIKEYKAINWRKPANLVHKGDILYFGGYLKGIHPILYIDSRTYFLIFSQEEFKEHFKIEE